MKKIHLMLIVILIAAAIYVMPEIINRVSKAQLLDQRPERSGVADVWYCPMHPHYTSDHPGNCPICNMKLVKREGHPSEAHALAEHLSAAGMANAQGYSTLNLDQHQQQLMGVRTVAVERKPLVKTIRTYGYVAHDLELYEAQLAYINAWREYFAFNTRRSVKGEYMPSWREDYKASTGRSRSSEYRQAQEKMLKAEYELKHLGLAEPQLQALREVKFGQPWVQPDLLFFHEGESVWVYAQIFEQDIGYVDVGQKAMVEIPAFNESYEGMVRSVSEIVDPATRTLRVRIELSKVRSELKVNMAANITMKVELDDALIIPREAMMDTGMQQVVFVQAAPGVFEPRQVKVKAEGDGVVAIQEGLKEGDQVVIDGNFLLDSESRLKAPLDGDAKGGGHVHGQ